jgi:hypothetical protein
VHARRAGPGEDAGPGGAGGARAGGVLLHPVCVFGGGGELRGGNEGRHSHSSSARLPPGCRGCRPQRSASSAGGSGARGPGRLTGPGPHTCSCASPRWPWCVRPATRQSAAAEATCSTAATGTCGAARAQRAAAAAVVTPLA